MAGIDAARARGVAHLSLSAVPACPDPESRFFRWAARHVVTRAGGPGLRQFKSAFGPRWVPLALTIALADITRAVRRPAPLRHPPAATLRHQGLSGDMSRDHNQDEYYEVASTEAA